MLQVFTRGALALFAATSLGAQAVAPVAALATVPDPLHQTGRNVTVSLLTMGNGDQVWELFGHTAIWIHDNVSNRDSVFNCSALFFSASSATFSSVMSKPTP